MRLLVPFLVCIIYKRSRKKIRRKDVKMSKAEDRIPTNLRAMLILEALGNDDGPLSASDIGRLVGIPKQTAHRLCNTLVDEGYLHRDIAHGLLRPGRRARGMASSILHASVSHIARHQVLEGVAKQIGETVNFVVPEAQARDEL